MASDFENLTEDYSNLQYYKKDKTKAYREIVLEAIEKCRLEGSKQMKKGGQYMTPEGLVMTAEDQREVFINSVESLNALLLFTFDKEAKDNLKGLQDVHFDETKDEDLGELPKKIRDLTQKYFDRYIEKEWYQPYKEQAKKEGRMVEGDKSGVAPFLTQQKEDERRALYMKIYTELSLLFKRKNELSGKRKLGAY